MHPLVFQIKRAHWRSVAVFGSTIRHLELTCARFDLMHALQSSPYGLLTQSKLARQLGVSRQTVWEMVVRMRRHRLVKKSRDPDSGRVFVELTRKGKRAITQAHLKLMKYGRVRRALRKCFPWFDTRDVRGLLSELKYHVRFIAVGFGDTSSYGEFIDPAFNPKPPDFGRARERRLWRQRIFGPPPNTNVFPPEPPPPTPPPTPPAPPRELRSSDLEWSVNIFDAIATWKRERLGLRR